MNKCGRPSRPKRYIVTVPSEYSHVSANQVANVSQMYETNGRQDYYGTQLRTPVEINPRIFLGFPCISHGQLIYVSSFYITFCFSFPTIQNVLKLYGRPMIF